MSIDYKNVGISVDGCYILSDSISISENSSLNPNYVFNYLVPIDKNPTNGIKNNISISYFLEPILEPNYNIINSLKIYAPSGRTPSILNIGNNIISGYLENYSFDITPNNSIKANASFVCFHEITGDFVNQSSSNLYNVLNSYGIAHYWTTQVFNQDFSNTGSIIQGNYSFKANWEPIYVLGNKYPNSVNFINAQEDFNFISENIKHSLFTGERAETAFNTYNLLRLNDIAYSYGQGLASLDFPLSGGIINNNEINVKTDNIITSKVSITKYY